MTYSVLLALSALVVLSYFFDVIASKTRFPSVFLLIATGILIRLIVDVFGVRIPDLSPLVQILGTVALILIVLEGGMDLDIEEHKVGILKAAFAASVLILVASSLFLAYLFFTVSSLPFSVCLLNAIPFAVISSAIAIPSVAKLQPHVKDFVVYESALCDILGIMLFNAIFYLEDFNVFFFGRFLTESAVMAGLSLLSCLVILYFMKKTSHKVKFFLIISILMALYAVGRLMHLSPLLIVFLFGLMLTNFDRIRAFDFQRIFNYDGFQEDYRQLKMVTMESAFLMRTFFFVVFGFSIQAVSLLNPVYAWAALGVTVVLFVVRFLFLRVIVGRNCWMECMVAPRGLISILLFLSIPAHQKIPFLKDPILLLTIIMTCGVMTFALLKAAPERTV